MMKSFKQFLNEDRWYEDPMGNYGSNLLTFQDSLKTQEGFVASRYNDPYGIPTIGYGAKIDADLPKTLRTVFPNKPKGWEHNLVKGKGQITKDEAQSLKDYQAKQKFDQMRNKLGPDIFDRFHNEVQIGIADANYRGAMLGSPITMQHLRNRNLRAAADEFLDNDEYRNALKNPKKYGGVAKRMETFANTLRKYADWENTELPPIK